MSDTSAIKLSRLISKEALKDIDHWIAKYPPDQKQSAVMSALRIVQEEHNHLTQELMDAVALYLEMPSIAVYEVASFYTMYEHAPVGKHLINVCTNISCQLNGCGEIVRHLEQKLGVKMGETTQDGQFTLRGVECLGACVNAPMMQVDKAYYEHLTTDSVDKVLEHYK